MHHTDTKSLPLARLLRSRQRGFNFAEVLFAVMILGIGFIMVAAIFPVAISQTKTTGEEIVASTLARGGVNYFQQVGLGTQSLPTTDLIIDPTLNGPPHWPNEYLRVANNPARLAISIPPNGGSLRLPGKMISFRDNRLAVDMRDAIWRQVSGNLILPQDPRAAWVGTYRRGITYTNNSGVPASPGEAGVTTDPDRYAHVVVIGVQIRNRSVYEPAKDLYRYNAAGAILDTPPASVGVTPATLEPSIVYVKLTERQENTTAATPDLADTITFYQGANGTAQITAADALIGPFAEGAYVVISDDQIADDPLTLDVYEGGQRNGRVYRLGVQRADLGDGVWELAPNFDLSYINPDAIVGNADDVNENIPPRTVLAPDVNATGPAAIAYIMGRGRTDPSKIGDPRDGLPQDTGVYVTLVPAN
jgi:hypothetical protein